jgi:hypothetical protein
VVKSSYFDLIWEEIGVPWFRVLVRGENFQMKLSGTVGTFGFFATRFVEVESPEAVESAAVDVIRKDPELKGTVLNDMSNPPMVFVDEIKQVSQSAVQKEIHGFTFFAAD